jgi:hypothetical protein
MTVMGASGSRASGRVLRRTVFLAVLGSACGGGAAPPGPDSPPAAVPDLRGARVMLFPVQSVQGVAAGADAELAFALGQRGSEVDWVFPDEMAGALAGSPGMDTRLEGLPVGMFLTAEVTRVGDPLYGYLRRVAALVDSELALIPVVARYRPGTVERAGAVEIAATLIAVRTGYVLWFGFVEGDAGAAGDPRSLASAADALGRRLLPFSVVVGALDGPLAPPAGGRLDNGRVTDGKELASPVGPRGILPGRPGL